MRISSILLLMLISFGGSASLAELSNEELAQQVAHCYVANQRGSTDIFKSGEAEKMRDVIAELIGNENINKTILIANRMQSASAIGGNGFAYKDVKKYCTSLDGMLITSQK